MGFLGIRIIIVSVICVGGVKKFKVVVGRCVCVECLDLFFILIFIRVCESWLMVELELFLFILVDVCELWSG